MIALGVGVVAFAAGWWARRVAWRIVERRRLRAIQKYVDDLRREEQLS